MSKIDNGGPAFPTGDDTDNLGNPQFYHPGMMLRDWFAMKVQIPENLEWIAPALMGEEPPNWSAKGDYEQSLKCNAWWATAESRYRYARADAMLAEKRRTEQ